MGLVLSFLVITTLLLTKYFTYNHKDGSSTTAANTKFKVHYNTVCASSPYSRKFLTALYAL